MTTKEQLREDSGAAYRCPTFEFMWSEIEKRDKEIEELEDMVDKFRGIKKYGDNSY